MKIRKRGADASQAEQDHKSWWRTASGSPRTRSVAVATGLLAVVISPFAVAATGDALREGSRNGTATRETQVVARVDSTTARTGGYSTRQSNLSSTGGGAIYGCRSGAGTSASTPTPQNPCIRANNLANGQAFEFATSGGVQAGSITVGSGGDTRKPFTTNATGVATGLNADRVDSLSADQIIAAAVNQVNSTAPAQSPVKSRWFLLGANGQILEQSGGFSVTNAYQTNQNAYIDTGATLEGHGLSATIGIQNADNSTVRADATTQQFTGEVSVARCQTAETRCAPAGTQNVNTLVVSPRNSDGTATAAANRKPVYVTVTE